MSKDAQGPDAVVERLTKVAEDNGPATKGYCNWGNFVIDLLAALEPGDELPNQLRVVSLGSPYSENWTVGDLLATARQEGAEEMRERVLDLVVTASYPINRRELHAAIRALEIGQQE